VVVAGECLVFAANGVGCPLTRLAEDAGAASGSVTDINLPTWLARSLPAIDVSTAGAHRLAARADRAPLACRALSGAD
jgi:hypothetical protein